MAARKSWNSLSPAYRRRLESHGVTAASHRSSNLKAARGVHKGDNPIGRADPVLTERVITGQSENLSSDLKKLRRSFTWPSWVPKKVSTSPKSPPMPVSTDVAAALSQLPDPSKWRGVEVIPRADGQAWTLIVEMKRGYDREILIPGGGGAGTGAKEVLAILTEVQNKQVIESEEKRRRREAESIFLEVLGSQ